MAAAPWVSSTICEMLNEGGANVGSAEPYDFIKTSCIAKNKLLPF